ncbi:carboxypeptidase-like regulatory domain-containing protein [Sabulilitoribacter multivorans]|uniref:Carboxypeptidase-like regulatory domain-containing protein n=1 Tax=Flaviramulus multivorans TaxID=1304750 RepID=A0ABS9IIF7_9FLAO|nr:carboxypeptidase-like regulatory domain-containing protein [Flaviramulus multivorans]MCF7560548.1 carboxypeptidase-like regulatory domain-containing protein [Flaviramulus multivorans]
MKLNLLILILILSPIAMHCQTIERVEVKGVILSKTNDVEAITVFNKSSNKGTITDENGAFMIEVAENDNIEISALQFQSVTIKVDKEIVESRQLKIQLIEQVNQLDAVTLSSGLSGNLETDITNVKVVKLTPIDLGNMNALNMDDDRAFDNAVIQNHLEATFNPEARNYLPDLVKIFDLLKSKNKPKRPQSSNLLKDSEQPKDVSSVYTHKYISEIFKIPTEQVEPFIAFMQNKGINPELLKPENEMQFIAFLYKQSDLFLKLNDVKE